MRGVRPAISLGALAGLLLYVVSLTGSLPRTTGLIAGVVGLLLVFVHALLVSPTPPAKPTTAVQAFADSLPPVAPAASFVMQVVGPYVRRDIDPALQYAIASGRPDNLILVSGDPRSGKTRSAWMAVQTIRPGALLCVVDEPRHGSTPGLARPLEAARTALDESPYDVLWLDDLALHIGRGLSASMLRDLADHEVLVVATVRESMLDVLRLTEPELWTELRVRARTFRMSVELSEAESESLSEGHVDSRAVDRRTLPHNDLLADRYKLGSETNPLGVAYVEASWLWRAFGMPRYCPAEILREIVHSLDGGCWAEAADEDHKAAIAWAVDSVGGSHGLMIHDQLTSDGYRVAEAVAGLVDASYEPDAMVGALGAVIAAAGDDDGLAVAKATKLLLVRKATESPCRPIGEISTDAILLEWVNTLLPPVEQD